MSGLRFLSIPTSVVAGEPFTVEVELLNPSGERTTGSRASVFLTLIGSGTLSGEVTVAASQGLARFEGLGLTTAGTGFLLQADVGTGASAVTAQSSQLNVTAAGASAEQSTAVPVANPLFPFGPNEITFTFKDAFGNLIANAPVSVTSSLAGSSLNPATGTTTLQGRFVTEFNPGGEGNVTFTATVGNATFAFATPLQSVDQCPPVQMTLDATVNGEVPAGACNADGRPAAAYRFSVASESGVAFGVASAFPALLEVQTNPPGSNVRFAPQDANPIPWLLLPGTYRFRVASLAAAGAFSVTSATSAGNSDAVLRAIVAPGTYTSQTITAADFAYGDGTFLDAFFLFSTRPCTITMRTAVFDAWLEAHDASTLPNLGQPFLTDDNSAGGVNNTDARLVLTQCMAPNGAPLLIIANNFTVPLRGAYTLTVSFDTPAALRAAGLQEETVADRLSALSSLVPLRGLTPTFTTRRR